MRLRPLQHSILQPDENVITIKFGTDYGGASDKMTLASFFDFVRSASCSAVTR